MLKESFSEKYELITRFAFANVLLVTNAFIWYFYAVIILEQVIDKAIPDYFTMLLIWSIHFAGLTLSALSGALLTKKVRGRTFFLVLWMTLGVASSLVLMILNISEVLCVLIVSFLFGISLGLGMPSCMGYYTKYTIIENRGRFGSIIMFVSGLGMFLLGTVKIESITLQAIILAILRASGLIIFLLTKPSEALKEKNEDHSYRYIIGQKPFILYVIPWTMFSLVTYLSTPVQFSILGKSLVKFLIIIENALIGVWAIIGGFLSDFVGRKRVTILGFVMLGLGYAILGIYPENLFSWYLYTLIDSIAWGFLFVIFVLTIWGDLSYGMPSDKYYAVGMLPFFVSKYLQLTIGDYVAAVIPSYAIFSFIALFLFLAVVPLIYAPETLPEKTIREREFKSYIEHAKKVKEKYT